MEHLILGSYSTKKQTSIGTGTTSQELTQSIMWLAAQLPDGDISTQPLDASNAPTGIVASVKNSDFFQKYIPEPKCYEENIRPGTQALLEWMGPQGTPFPKEKPEKSMGLFFRGFLSILHGDRGVAMREGDEEKLRALVTQANEMQFFEQFRVGISFAAVLQRKQKNYPLAIDFYTQALEIKEDDHLLFNTARTYYEMKNIDAARQCLEKALLLNPELLVAKQFLDFINTPSSQ